MLAAAHYQTSMLQWWLFSGADTDSPVPLGLQSLTSDLVAYQVLCTSLIDMYTHTSTHAEWQGRCYAPHSSTAVTEMAPSARPPRHQRQMPMLLVTLVLVAILSIT